MYSVLYSSLTSRFLIGWSLLFLRLAVHDCRSPLGTHIDLLPPSLNRRLYCGLVRGEGFGQIELRFHDPIRIVFLDGELGREHTR